MNSALKVISFVLAFLSAVALLSGFGVLYFAEGDVSFSAQLNFYLFFVLLIAGILSDTLLHELGHSLFGRISGFPVKISFRSVVSASYGYASIIPKKENALKARFIVTASGGLAVNFLFMLLSVLALAVPQIPICLSGLGVGHAILFFKNVFPVQYNSGKTDMLVITQAAKNSPEFQVTFAVLKAQSHILNGKPIEELDESVLFSLPQIREDDPAFISLCELRAQYLKAVGEEKKAEEEQARFEELKGLYL